MQRRMTRGPDRFITMYNKVEINGVQFGCKDIEENQKAKNSIVMLRRDEGDKTCGGIHVGRVHSFIVSKAPGTGEEVNILDARWFKEPAGEASWDTDLRCPVVFRDFKPRDPSGDYWRLEDMPAVKLILAPHLDDPGKKKWQVLHVHSDFVARSQL